MTIQTNGSYEDSELFKRIDTYRREGRTRRAKKAWLDNPARRCIQCQAPTNNHTFCAPECRIVWINVHKKDPNSLPVIGNLSLGKVCEYVVTVDLIRKGYEVFTAASPGAVYDLIAANKETDALVRIQVRAGKLGARGKVIPTNRSNNRKHDVVAAVDGDIVHYFPELPNVVAGCAIS